MRTTRRTQRPAHHHPLTPMQIRQRPQERRRRLATAVAAQQRMTTTPPHPHRHPPSARCARLYRLQTHTRQQTPQMGAQYPERSMLSVQVVADTVSVTDHLQHHPCASRQTRNTPQHPPQCVLADISSEAQLDALHASNPSTPTHKQSHEPATQRQHQTAKDRHYHHAASCVSGCSPASTAPAWVFTSPLGWRGRL